MAEDFIALAATKSEFSENPIWLDVENARKCPRPIGYGHNYEISALPRNR
jgi:hypothetical protein